MFDLNCFIFHIMQEYKRKTNRGKTTQDFIDRASAAVAGGQCLTEHPRQYLSQTRKMKQLLRRMMLSLGYHSLK